MQAALSFHPSGTGFGHKCGPQPSSSQHHSAGLLTTTQGALSGYSLTRAIVLSLDGFTVLP